MLEKKIHRIFRNILLRWVAVLLLAGTGFVQASAQEVHATARVDSNNIMIGDWLKVHLEVEHPANIPVKWPSISDSMQGIEVLQRDSVISKPSGSNVVESLNLTITGFDSGAYVIPPLSFEYSTPGDTVKKSAETSPIPVFIHTLAVDTTKDIKDIKPPLSLSIALAEILPYAIGTIIIALIFAACYYIIKRRSRGEPIIPEAPKRPAHEVALDALRSLESEHVWQRGLVKQYYSQLTDILRTYIEGRYGVMAMEMTTDEIMESHQVKGLTREVKDPLNELLVRADFVKFAKFQPTPQENEKGIAMAQMFVEQTWRQSEPAGAEPQPVEMVADEVR